MKRFILAAALTSLAVSPALAQQTQGGLINLAVDGGVLNDLQIANGSLNNNTVQVPISVAAAICNIPVNVLAKSRNTGDCRVTQRNMTSAVKNRILKQARKSK